MARSLVTVQWTWLAALLIAAAVAGSARAQDTLSEPPERSLSAAPDGPKLSQEQADRKARALFEQGRQAYADGHYRDAWDYFRQAYLLSKRPELLYNVGQSADRLRMDREAIEAFKLYLQKLPDAENRREVENRVRALEERQRADAADDPAYAALDDQDDHPNARFARDDAAAGEADDGEANGDETAPPAGGQPEREGWYASGGLGLGLLRDSIGNLGADASLGSATLVGQVALGHQVLEPGLVLGGTLMFEWSLAPSVSVGSLSTDVDTANLAMAGPFVDLYLSPREDGWHLFGALTVAWFSLSDRSATIGVEDASGGALVLGGGYEWPFGREWALGVLGRLTLAKVDQDTGKHNVGVLSVLCTGTWF